MAENKSKSSPIELLIENDVSATIGKFRDEKAKILDEIDRYLCEKTTTNIHDGLKNFPCIREIFFQYNCIRSSEAICERLFSYAGSLQNDKILFCDVLDTCLCCLFVFVSTLEWNCFRSIGLEHGIGVEFINWK